MPQVLVTPVCKIQIHNSVSRTNKFQKVRKIKSYYIWFSVTSHLSKCQSYVIFHTIDVANNTCYNTQFENDDQVWQYQPCESFSESICFQVPNKKSLRQC